MFLVESEKNIILVNEEIGWGVVPVTNIGFTFNNNSQNNFIFFILVIIGGSLVSTSSGISFLKIFL